MEQRTVVHPAEVGRLTRELSEARAENARLSSELQARTKELNQSLDQQAATSEILKALSRSHFDLQKVLETLIQSAAELCGADIGSIRLREGASYPVTATYGYKPEWRDHIARYPPAPDRSSIFGRTALEGRTIHVPDVLADPEFERLQTQQILGFRAALGVPLLRDRNGIGVLVLQRFEPGEFTPKQIQLVETFADQAVIAIENARLFGEVEARTRELTEALKQQIATADVLKVISRSAFDLQTVLDTLVASAAQLCEAEKGVISLRDGEVYHLTANVGFSAEFMDYSRERPFRPGGGTATGRALLKGETVHIHDVLADPEYHGFRYQEKGDFRTILSVPLARENVTIGVFSLTRSEVRPFTDKQIELLEVFADQAVIAIQNARLFEEVQARTADLQESLSQQTATADVLKVISRSAFDLQSVLNTLVDSAARLCDADMVSVTRPREAGGAHYHVASVGFSPEWFEYMQTYPLEPDRGTLIGRALLESRNHPHS